MRGELVAHKAMTPHQREPNVNNALGILLQGMLSSSQVRSENTQVITGHPGRTPDVLITAPDRAPVVIEAEYLPAANAESEAKGRLGLEVAASGRVIEAAIALRYPKYLEDADDLQVALKDALLSYCLFNDEGRGIQRFPQSGWLDGSVEDLANMVRLVSVPQASVDSAARALQTGIDATAAMLEEEDKSRPGVTAQIARILGMANVPQTRKMACAIIANAMVFHGRIAGMHEGIKQLHHVCGQEVANPQEEILKAWSDILKINYWPIFAVARSIVGELSPAAAAQIMRALEVRVWEMSAKGIDNSHDLTGRVFQRLIADRKYLATFYTLPASAALLARLAVAKMQRVDWSDAEAIGKLRVGDFACGTGALLSAVYEQIASRHDGAGGDLDGLHRVMMEEVLYGCDVMPSAVHITGSTLAGVQPNVGFSQSRLYVLPYGRSTKGTVSVGSLELIRASAAFTAFDMHEPALRTGSDGDESAAQVIADIPHGGFDLVIMNPPFPSNTKHYDAAGGVLNAAFAAFNSSRDDQSAMANRLNYLAKDTCYHGHAGEGSVFAALANNKLRPNGVIALVLPFTAINGASWAKFRELIATQYNDITIVSIAANGGDMSFSSDTGMAECLVIGRKIALTEKPDFRAKFISLLGRPRSFVHSLELAKGACRVDAIRRLEDGPYGGTHIYSGAEVVGEMLDVPVKNHQKGWGAARILDASVAQVAYSLSVGELWLPTQSNSQKLMITPLNQVGRRGLDHQLLVSVAHKGPFSKMDASDTATYPAIWNHHATEETRMICAPDLQLVVRPGMEEKAGEIWATASRTHLNSEFTFGSQALAVAFTERKSIGGRVWPNMGFDDERYDYAFSIWCNGTLGLLSYWWHSSRQQSSKAGITVNLAELMPVLDFRTLSDKQLAIAEAIFEEFRDKELKPAYLADADPNRALLDQRVVCDLLGFDEEVYAGVRRLAAKWCAEPSVHGGKARPKGGGVDHIVQAAP